jgi:hypothetical protein
MTHVCRKLALGIIVSALLPVAAQAQLGDLLKSQSSQGSSGLGSLGGLGSALSGQSISSGNLGNIAGVLQFCIKNNYLGGGDASSVKNGLLGKLSGGSQTSDPGYGQGVQGLLDSGSGKTVDLSGSGGLKSEITKKICDKVLSTGKSML